MKELISILLIVVLSGCTHKEYKNIKIYYTDNTTEVISIKHNVYEDGSFSKVMFSDGCISYPTIRGSLRCGVKKFIYL